MTLQGFRVTESFLISLSDISYSVLQSRKDFTLRLSLVWGLSSLPRALYASLCSVNIRTPQGQPPPGCSDPEGRPLGMSLCTCCSGRPPLIRPSSGLLVLGTLPQPP